MHAIQQHCERSGRCKRIAGNNTRAVLADRSSAASRTRPLHETDANEQGCVRSETSGGNHEPAQLPQTCSRAFGALQRRCGPPAARPHIHEQHRTYLDSLKVCTDRWIRPTKREGGALLRHRNVVEVTQSKMGIMRVCPEA